MTKSCDRHVMKQGAGRTEGDRPMKTRRFWLTAALAGALVAPMVASAQVRGISWPGSAAVRLPADSDFPSLASADGWLNSPPLTPAGLRGKVVLVDFWTYT